MDAWGHQNNPQGIPNAPNGLSMGRPGIPNDSLGLQMVPWRLPRATFRTLWVRCPGSAERP